MGGTENTQNILSFMKAEISTLNTSQSLTFTGTLKYSRKKEHAKRVTYLADAMSLINDKTVESPFRVEVPERVLEFLTGFKLQHKQEKQMKALC